jgi:hypothetical protein
LAWVLPNTLDCASERWDNSYVPALPPEALYEQARSAGLTIKTAREVSRPLIKRSRLSGDWPDMNAIADPVKDLRYAGRAATIDSGLWLKKLGMALMSHVTVRELAATGLPIVTNCRVRLDDWWLDGCLALDLEHRHVGGRRVFTTCRVPVGACIDHDTDYVLRRVLVHLGQRNITRVENAIITETDLRHVRG